MNQKIRCGLVQRYPIVGGRRLSNYWWSIVLFLGGCGFLLTGVSSFFDRNFLLLTPTTASFGVLPLECKEEKQEHVVLSKENVSCFSSLHSKGSTPKDAVSNSVNSAKNSYGVPYTNTDLNLSAILLRDFRSFPVPLLRKEEAEDRKDCEPFNPLHIEGSVPKEEGTHLSELRLATIAFVPKTRKQGMQPNLPFFPQGLVLSFYGFFGLCFSFYLWFTLIWNVGAGFNEFNGKNKSVRVFRWGRPGKNRRVDFKYAKELIETIKIELVPKPALFLRVKGEKNIPLTRIGEFIPLEDLEAQAAELTSLLQIPLEIAD